VVYTRCIMHQVYSTIQDILALTSPNVIEKIIDSEEVIPSRKLVLYPPTADNALIAITIPLPLDYQKPNTLHSPRIPYLISVCKEHWGPGNSDKQSK